jgi:vacuolar protein sorting-associated protein 53
MWGKRKLREYEQRYSQVFPESWRMDQFICEEFAHKTRKQLAVILEKASQTLNVKVLLHAFRETLKWEKEISDYFSSRAGEENAPSSPRGATGSVFTDEPETQEDEDEEDPNSPAAIEKRYRKFLEQRQQQQDAVPRAPPAGDKFKQIISTVFDPYMTIYIQEEEKLMKLKFDQILQEESWEVEDDARNKVLGSSTELMFYFKKSMTR